MTGSLERYRQRMPRAAGKKEHNAICPFLPKCLKRSHNQNAVFRLRCLRTIPLYQCWHASQDVDGNLSNVAQQSYITESSLSGGVLDYSFSEEARLHVLLTIANKPVWCWDHHFSIAVLLWSLSMLYKGSSKNFKQTLQSSEKIIN